MMMNIMMVSSQATFSVVMATVFPNGESDTIPLMNDSIRRYTIAFVRIDGFDEQSHKK